MSFLNVYRPQVQAYRDTAETWRSDHDEAMACRDLEEVLRLGVSLYDMLDELDMDMRARAPGDDEPQYTEETNKAFDALFEWWLEPHGHVIAAIEAFEAKEYTVGFADEFRQRVRQALAAKED